MQGCRAALAALVLAAGAPVAMAQSGETPATSTPVVPPVVERARTLLEQGAGEDGRALLDSLVRVQRAGSMELAEALYWRGVLAEKVADAERDWKRLVIEVPLSPRTADALVRLGELASMRGKTGDAAGYYERVVRDFPSGMARTKSLVWLARSAMDGRDTEKACGWWREVRGAAGVEGELRLQMEGMEGRCTAGAPTTGTPTAGSPTTRTQTTGGRGGYSVQLAAYANRQEAEGLVTRLGAKGIEARVDGDSAPFRVRVGRFALRAEAAQRLNALKAQGYTGFIAELPRAGGTR